MPYRSDKQRRFMHAVHPDIAARWDRETGGRVVKKRKKYGRKRLARR
jgi:hypothetical protein